MKDKKNYSPRRGITKRFEREVRHNERASQEHSKFLTTIQFIKSFFVYWDKGSENEPKNSFIVSFNLIEPVYPKDFKEYLNNKLGVSVIESI